MQEQESILLRIKEEFQLGEQELNSYSPLVLAYLGDCVYELIIRTILVGQANCQVRKLHKRATRYVKAGAQAELVMSVMDMLTEEEIDVFRRGKNAKSHTIPKNANVGEYKKATGLEAVIGYLYLKNDMDRALFIVKMGLERVEQQDREGDEY